jgi:hypothetical protein
MLHPWDEGVRGTQVPVLINSDAIIRCVAGPDSGKTFGLVRRVERILPASVLTATMSSWSLSTGSLPDSSGTTSPRA